VSKTIRIKLSAEEHAEFLQFHSVIQGSGEDLQPLTQESLAKQCVFYAINDSRQRAARLMEQREEEMRRAQMEQEYAVQPVGATNSDPNRSRDTSNNTPERGASAGSDSATPTDSANTTTNT
jgi:hypothetical protein